MFDFSIYKGNSIYFRLFDGYFKETNTRKDVVFKKLYINNCSYRRCREGEYKIGIEIIESLTDYFNLKKQTNELVDQVEELAERVYYNMYYKIYDTYEDNLKFINDLLNDNTILFPILEILKLFLEVNSKKSPKAVLEETKNDFEHVKRYRLFFTKELNDILDILTLFYDKDIEDHKWGDTYDNPLSYQILAARASVKENHIAAIHYANKAKELFIEDMNIRRIITMNFTIMNNLLRMGNYEKAYDMAVKHMYSVIALNEKSYNYDRFLNIMLASMIGMRKYEFVIDRIEKIEKLSSTNFIFLLISYFSVNKEKYKEYYYENLEFDSIIILDEYLRTKDKKLLLNLSKKTYTPEIIRILREL